MMEKRPMVCVTDADGKIYPLGGNMRLKALKELAFKEIPDTWVIFADEWSEEKRKEFTIKDNSNFGDWDFDSLSNWDSDKLILWGVEIPNWEIGEDENIQTKDISDKLKPEYKIEITCTTEHEQEQLYNELIEKGIECRILTL